MQEQNLMSGIWGGFSTSNLTLFLQQITTLTLPCTQRLLYPTAAPRVQATCHLNPSSEISTFLWTFKKSPLLRFSAGKVKRPAAGLLQLLFRLDSHKSGVTAQKHWWTQEGVGSHPNLASVSGDQDSFRTFHFICYIYLCHFGIRKHKGFLEEQRIIWSSRGVLSSWFEGYRKALLFLRLINTTHRAV